MAIDTASKRITSSNLLTGYRILIPRGLTDQTFRQAGARTASAIFAIPKIVFFDGAITIEPALIYSTLSNTSSIDAAVTIKPYNAGTGQTNQ